MSKVQIPAIVLNDTRIDRHHGCSAVMTALFGMCSKHGINIIKTFALGYDYGGSIEYSDWLGKVRLVIINGEGTLHHDAPRGVQLLRAAKLAKEAGKTVVLINSTWEGNGDEAHELVSKLDLLFVRDSASAIDLASRGIHASVLPDLSFSFVSMTGLSITQTANDLTFSDSVVRAKNCSLWRLWKQTGGRLVPVLSSSEDLSVWSFARPALSRHGENLFSKNLINLLFRLTQYKRLVSRPEEYLAQLQSSKLHVTGRYHACTMSAALGVPFLGFESNTKKIANLVSDIGLDASRSSSSFNSSQVRDYLEKGWNKGELAALNEYRISGMQNTERAFAQIHTLVSGR